MKNSTTTTNLKPTNNKTPTVPTQLTLDASNPPPTKTLLTLKAKKKEIGNKLKKNDEITLLVHTRVNEVHFADNTRKHVAAIVDFVPYDTDNVSTSDALTNTTTHP